MRCALVFDGGGRSQEYAGAFRTGKSAIFVVVIVISPGYVVGNQVPGVVRLVLGGLRKSWADRRGDGTNGGDRGTPRKADLGGVKDRKGIERMEGEVRDELRAVVLDLEGERGDRPREGHSTERERERREDEGVLAARSRELIMTYVDRGRRLAPRKSAGG